LAGEDQFTMMDELENRLNLLLSKIDKNK
jgi:hypothetical protein